MNKIDKFTKVILTVIALNPWLQPVTVSAAQDNSEYYLVGIESAVETIEHDLHRIYLGLCLNSKIC